MSICMWDAHAFLIAMMKLEENLLKKHAIIIKKKNVCFSHAI
jgi:hypothetical protein